MNGDLWFDSGDVEYGARDSWHRVQLIDEPCVVPCDEDCEIAPVHCMNLHLPRHKWLHAEGECPGV